MIPPIKARIDQKVIHLRIVFKFFAARVEFSAVITASSNSSASYSFFTVILAPLVEMAGASLFFLFVPLRMSQKFTVGPFFNNLSVVLAIFEINMAAAYPK